MKHNDETTPDRDDQRTRRHDSATPHDDARPQQPTPDRLPDGTTVGSSNEDSKHADREGD